MAGHSLRQMRERVVLKSPVRENRPPGSVRGAPGNRRPYRDITVRFEKLCASGGESPSSLAENRWNSEPKVMNGKV